MDLSRFDGRIAGAGSASGVRLVVGLWADSPFGRFGDVMLEEPDGHRVLLAPSERVADYVSGTYHFDQVVTAFVHAERRADGWHVLAGDEDHRLRLRLGVGARTSLGLLLRAVPRPLATRRWFTRAEDLVASRVLPGVHTVGTAGRGRTEYYSALDQHELSDLDGVWRGEPLGALRPVDPPVRFGFGSTPTRPTIQRIVTTIAQR